MGRIMHARHRKALDILSRYGLAACCVLGPLLFATVFMTLAFNELVPKQLAFEESNKITFKYSPSEPKAKSIAGPADKSAAAGGDKAEAMPNRDMYLPARHYYGRSAYAVASGFLYLISAAVLLFSIITIVQRWGWTGVVLGLLFFGVIVLDIAYGIGIPRGRHLVVDQLLNKADEFDTLKQMVGSMPTGDTVRRLVRINTIASLIPVGMILLALASLSVRPTDNKLDPAELKSRLAGIQCAMMLASGILVVGVLANKTLVDWPLTLVAEPDAAALRPIADALTLQLGASGTIAMFAAFAPAMTAWSLDVARYRAIKADPTRSAAKTEPAKSGAIKSEPSKPAAAAETEPDARLIFAPLSTIAAIFAALAPILASPFFDGLKAILGPLVGK
jgi:hypothetical protein